MAPPLLGLEPKDLQSRCNTAFSPQTRAGGATRHAPRQPRPLSPATLAAPTVLVTIHAPRRSAHAGSASLTTVIVGFLETLHEASFPLQFRRAFYPTAAPTGGAAPGAGPIDRAALLRGVLPLVLFRSDGDGRASHLPSFSRLRHPLELRTFCATAPHSAPAPLPRPRSIPATPPTRRAVSSPGTPTAAGGLFSGHLGDSGLTCSAAAHGRRQPPPTWPSHLYMTVTGR